MGHWRDNLLKASWRGVQFGVRSTSVSVGRRTVVHEFPAQTLPAVEDLGRATRRFEVEGVVVGTDYTARRDELRKALEKGGKGELVLPTWGVIQATLEEPAQLTESPDEGGLCRFSAKWVEATDALRDVHASDPKAVAADAVALAKTAVPPAFAAQVAAAADAYEAAVGADVVSSAAGAVSNAPVPAVVQASVLSRISAAIGNAIAAVDSGLATLSLPQETLQNLRAQVRTLTAQASELAATPEKAAAAMQALVGEAVGLAGDVSDLAGWAMDPVSRLLSMLFDARPEAAPEVPLALLIPEKDPGTALASAMESAAQRLRLSALLTSAAGTALDANYATSDDAQAVADALSTLLEAAIDAPASVASEADAEARRLISEAVGLTVRFLREESARLPQLSDYTPATTLPAVLLAHRLYGDARRADELIRLNALPDPLRVPGAVPLKVLSHDD